MSAAQQPALSSPKRTTAPPREPSAAELAALVRVADLLIPGTGTDPAPSAAEGYTDALRLALAARADEFEGILATGAATDGRPDDEVLADLRSAHEAKDPAFHTLSSVLANAYLVLLQVKRKIGYPGQGRDVPRIDEAAEEIGDGILDPVIERGRIYVPVEPIR